MTRARVYISSVFCGVLTEDHDGYHFQYDADYITTEGAMALSPTMPLQSEPYTKEFMFPVFDGLIPEGWMLKIVDKTWKINPHDRMKLLLTFCKDCIGDISIMPYEE